MAQYTTIFPTMDDVFYTTANPTLDYVESNIETLFGPINAPKIYAQELSALELASSGKIAFSMLDEHALDLSKDSTHVLLRARDGLALKLLTESSNVFLSLDESASNLDMSAGSNVSVSAGDVMSLTSGGDMKLDASGLFDLSVDDTVAMKAGGNMSAHTAGSLTLGSSNMITVDATSDMKFMSSTLLSEVDTTVTVNAGGDVMTYSAADVGVSASNNVAFTAVNSNMTLAAGDDISATADRSMVLTTVTSNIKLDAKESIDMDAETSILQTTALYQVDVTNAMVYASDGVTLDAVNEMTISSSNNASLTSVNKDIVLTAGEDIMGTADSNIVLKSTNSNILLDADKTVKVKAGVSIVYETPTFEIDAENLAFTADSNIALTASNVLDLNSVKEMTLDAGTTIDAVAQQKATFKSANNDVEITAKRDVTVTATDRTLGFVSGAATTVDAGTDFTVSADSNISLTSVQSTTLESTQKGVEIKAHNDHKAVIAIGGQNILEVYRTAQFDPTDSNNLTDYKFKINADLEVLGTQNTIDVNQTSLFVEDKEIHLAFDSNLETPTDGPGNDGAGVVVDGLPAGGDTNNYEWYEKSFKWHHGGAGVTALGGTDVENESYWNLRGGNFRITQTDDENGKQVAFGFRINQLDELELYKMYNPSGSPGPITGSSITKRIAKFGRVIA